MLKPNPGYSELDSSLLIREERLGLILVVLFYAFFIGAGQKFYLSNDQFFWRFNKPSYDFLAFFSCFFLFLHLQLSCHCH